MRLQDVWFRYGRRAPWVLRAVDVTVHAGETVVVLGRNGAGKSTLLQLVAGVLRPVRGAVHDRPAVVGWVPERFPADQPFTSGQYLRAMAALRGDGAVDGWLERLGLVPYRDVKLPELSKGTAQKVGLAQALLVSPGLLVLDEPWEGLDADARELVPDIVAEVTGAGGAVLVSDHRAEISRLPAARRWTVDGGTVTVDDGPASRPPAPEPADGMRSWVVEVAVSASDPTSAAQRLRADGHEVLAVRSAERQARR